MTSPRPSAPSPPAAPAPARTGDQPGGLLPAVLMLSVIALILILGREAVPFLLALLLAWASHGAMEALQRRGANPAIAALGATLLATAGLLAVLLILSLVLLDQIVGLMDDWPQLSRKLLSAARGYLLDIGLPDQARALSQLMRDPLGAVSGNVGTVGSVAWSLTGSTLNTLLLLLLTPFLTFYFLKDGRMLVRKAGRWLRPRQRTQVAGFFLQSRQRLSDFLRGQLTLCAVQAAFHAIGLWLIGLEFGVLIGLATGAASIIPVLGNFTMFTIAMTVALLQGEGWMLPLMVAGLYALSELLETAVLAPLLVGNRIEVHPLFIIAALVIGGSLFGLWGAILALPFAAIASTFVEEFGPPSLKPAQPAQPAAESS